MRFLFYFCLSTHAIWASAFELGLERGWALRFDGFFALSLIDDSKASFNETLGNGPVQSSDSSQFLETIRYSRLSFTLLAPDLGLIKSKLYLEIDFAGSKVDREQDLSNATIRIRHAYYMAESPNWTLLVGQSWTLFGWSPTYFLSTVSYAPSPAMLYQRTTEIIGSTNHNLGGLWNLQIAGSIAQPSQRRSGYPNFIAGAALSYAGIQAPIATLSGDPKLESIGLALSATTRKFKAGLDASSPQNTVTGFATAINAFVPLLPSRNSSLYETLTLRASFAQGTGYADALPGWTGNLAALPNLDAGQGGFNDQNNFNLSEVMTWNAQLQARLSEKTRVTLNVGYGQVRSQNSAGLGPIAKSQMTDGPYDQIDFYFLNCIKDFTPAIRVGLEYSRDITSYSSAAVIADDRYLALVGYRF